MLMMVTPTSRYKLLFFFRLCASCCFLLSYHAHIVTAASPFSFSFDFTNRSSYRQDDLKFEGDAVSQAQLVDLTCSSRVQTIFNCNGRMSYNHSVPFYNTATGEVASFSTRFDFNIRLPGQYAGDGMAFFLSSYPPSVLLPSSGGGNLGLHSGDGLNAEGTDRFIAVEFDTYKNTFDSMFEHIGIDVNTVRSSLNATSVNGSMTGPMTASITFNSTTRMLVASLHFHGNSSRGSYEVSKELTYPITDYLPSEVAVGFSAATGLNVELHQIMSWSFNSTLARKGTRNHILYAASIGGPFVLVVILVVVIFFYVACYKHKHRDDSFVKGVGDLAKRFEYRELAAATDEFSNSRELGEGAFGIVYEGKLTEQDGQQHQVAVKKIKGTNEEIKDFHAELKTISETRHKNLVRLKGWCCRSSGNFIDFMCWWRHKESVELFLVYELVPNGNLDLHLHKNEEVLTWAKRYNIVKGIGSALRYLHYECNKCILHRDIKPGNILLDEKFNAKLADFGLSRIAHQKNEAVLTSSASETLGGDVNTNAEVLTLSIGTPAYMDPKCMKHGIVSLNLYSDVYSFGIGVLEIACTGKSRAEVWDVYKRNPETEDMSDAADARLDGDLDVAQMRHVAVLGLWCSLYDDNRRPSMKEAMEVLEHDATLPNLLNNNVSAAGVAS